MQFGDLFPRVMGAPIAVALFLAAVFVLGLLAAPIVWFLTAAHDRKERERTEPDLIGVARAPGTRRHSRSTLNP